ncbi:vacuolar protein sorting protein 16 [Trypanosoma grayi]|uniref:vacuolar protein sorting protein 16 n=1 Tax=Trypanosoma grayi TaxID=71804 RepID=UPI0004F4AF41|nr:vacuolar protein sorting protein 16 [Trypanosoma grayi]KEG07470.1 vacuolar protein sorting protein 16 [Trypanosoma grayi]
MAERLGEWFPFNSELYCRRLTLYDQMHWDAGVAESSEEDGAPFSFARCDFVCAAPFGGSVAVIPSLTSSDATACGGAVRVYTSAGEFQANVCVPADVGAPIDMGWTKEESLVVLTEQQACVFFDSSFAGGGSTARRDAAVSSRTIRLQDVASTSSSVLGLRVTPTVLSCMRAEGLFCIDQDGWLRGVLHEERRGPRVLDPVLLELGSQPAAMDFIPAEWNDDDETVLYVATMPRHRRGDSILHVFISSLDYSEKLRRRVPGGAVAMKVNHNGSHIALYTNCAALYVISSNMKSVDFSILLGPQSKKPSKMEWCGPSFVMLHFSNPSVHCGSRSRADAPMFSLLIPTLPEASVRCERLDWELEGSGRVATVAEVDGVRVITELACYFIEQVPRSLASLCRIKPLSRAAHLVAAHADAVNRLPRVRRLLSKWGNTAFAEVLDEIIDAAAHEFSPDQQHLLLLTAAFANEVNRQYDSDTFVDVVRRLRVLHAVRNHPGCRMPLSFRQYCALAGSEHMRTLAPSEAQVLVDRLTNRCCFQLAFDIASALCMKPLRLLSQWACYKVRDSSLDDATVHAHVREVLGRYPGSSYVQCSLTAFRTGRSTLATTLLNEDFRAHSKVTVFLLLGQWELAMQWAAMGDDADLLHLALAKAVASVEDRGKLFSVLLNYPAAVAWILLVGHILPTWKEICEEMCTRHGDATLALYHARCSIARAVEGISGAPDGEARKEKLTPRKEEADETIDKSMDNKGISGINLAAASRLSSILKQMAPPSLGDAVAALGRCRQLRSVAGGKFSIAATAANYPLVFPPFSAETLEEEWRWLSLHRELLQTQQQLAAEYHDPRFRHCSVVRTVYLCFLHGGEKRAEELRVKYHVSEKKYTYTKLLALCDAGRWAEAEGLGGASGGRFVTRPPIGYLPFVEQFAHRSQAECALRFVPHLDGVAKRVEWFMKLEQPRLAIDDAFHARDASLIQQIIRKTRDTATQEYGERRLQELS